MKLYILEHFKTGDRVQMFLEEILEEINMDRNREWLDYDESDWQEGLDFTEYNLVGEVMA